MISRPSMYLSFDQIKPANKLVQDIDDELVVQNVVSQEDQTDEMIKSKNYIKAYKSWIRECCV